MLYYKISSKIISHYFISYSKYRPLPLTVQGSPIGWLAGKKSSSLRSGIFFRQALHRSLAKNSRASKKLKYWLHGAGHV